MLYADKHVVYSLHHVFAGAEPCNILFLTML
jgi:hypothetical protein